MMSPATTAATVTETTATTRRSRRRSSQRGGSRATAANAATPLAAALLAFSIFFYAVVYTMWLKRSTAQNIVIGGAAGAFPPVIGWAAATGNAPADAWILFGLIFLWTPPHFWALALFKAKDYGAAGIPMMPNVAGEASTKLQIFLYALLVAPVAVLPWYLGFAGSIYGIVSSILGAMFVWQSYSVWKMPDGDKAMVPAKKLFGYSLVYLFALFSILLGEAIVLRFSAGGL